MSSPSPSPPPSREMQLLGERVKLMLSLSHATWCRNTDAATSCTSATVPQLDCRSARELLRHARDCTETSCAVTSCAAAREISQHAASCVDETCEMCFYFRGKADASPCSVVAQHPDVREALTHYGEKLASVRRANAAEHAAQAELTDAWQARAFACANVVHRSAEADALVAQLVALKLDKDVETCRRESIYLNIDVAAADAHTAILRVNYLRARLDEARAARARAEEEAARARADVVAMCGGNEGYRHQRDIFMRNVSLRRHFTRDARDATATHS